MPNKKEGKDQDSLQSSTTSDPAHKRAMRSALSQQVNTRLHETTKTNTSNRKDPKKKHRLGRKLLQGLNFFHGTNLTLSSVVG